MAVVLAVVMAVVVAVVMIVVVAVVMAVVTAVVVAECSRWRRRRTGILAPIVIDSLGEFLGVELAIPRLR